MRAHMPGPPRPPLSIVMAGVSAPTTPHRIARRATATAPPGQPTRAGAHHPPTAGAVTLVRKRSRLERDAATITTAAYARSRSLLRGEQQFTTAVTRRCNGRAPGAPV